MIDQSSPHVSDDVGSFYERYPYPPPLDNLDQYRKAWQDENKRRADFHLFWPHKPFAENFSILIAGCGTSQAAKHAMRWPQAQVHAIDLSATSIRCTEDLKSKYNLANLEIHQLPIDQVSQLGKTFDQIVCTGVLHHLKNPDAALRALHSVLNPDGAMHIMVYAPYGRSGIYMLQEFCQRLGIHASDEAIRDLVASLGALPPGHPLETLLRQAPDFRHEAAIADALLHPQDRAYSVAQLFNFIETAGLTFTRWVRQAPYSHHCGVMAKIPQSAPIASLAPAEQYAAIELFRGTMTRHSIIVSREDSAVGSQQINFSDDVWLSYIPIRMSDTICIQERLPPGAAAVLINQAHTYRDMFLPIGSAEKLLFDAIDGGRSIGKIMHSASVSSSRTTNLDTARTFFEQLWWHDQLVFDASRPA
jgi:SAM-dependent methyltransferase